MRTEQFIGLNDWAREFIRGGDLILAYTEEIVRVYPDGRREPQPSRPVYRSLIISSECGVLEGAFGGSYPLHRYTFPDGRIYEEFLQMEPWSSGPMYFLALRHNGEPVPESLWSDMQLEVVYG